MDLKKTVSYEHAGKIIVGDGEVTLYKHQEEAMKELNRKILDRKESFFSGLLVLPTGGGKTLTAVYWLLKNYIDKGKKILWIAHRHELLNQAKETFEDIAFKNILNNKSSFNYRIISGIHDRPVNIKSTDDLIISSKDSLNSGFEYLYNNWIGKNNGEVFLIIDEAHHATAKTYRKIVNNIRDKVNCLKILGLTATPTRTAEVEKGLLKKVFPDDIIYKTDLRTLIHRGILSEPVFEEIKTEIDMTELISERELDHLKYFDIDSLGTSTAKTIAENARRNKFIVDHYIKHKKRYNQTIVFALNVDNAVALNTLFNDRGIKSDYVVSAMRDMSTGVTTSPKDNKEKIKAFKNSELDVLINVNILTEGVDVPKVQTVFLTRPTISTILMTQMIGRGLRGEKAGGTKEAYIVSFIDEWKDKIAWVNPEKLFIQENTDFADKTSEIDKKVLRLISIEKIKEYIEIIDPTIDTRELEAIDFIQRIPVGIYPFTILKTFEDEERDKNCEILVYDNIKSAYENFIVSLPDFFTENNLTDRESFTEDELEILCNKVDNEFFYGCEKFPGYIREDIKDLLTYYVQKEELPGFIELKDREKYDIAKIADEIYEKDFGERKKKEYLDKIWNDEEIAWKTFFGYDQVYFLNEIDLAIRKLKYPHLYINSEKKPMVEQELRGLEKLSMAEIYERYPEYWRKLRDGVYEKSKDKEGYYTSALSDFKSKNTRHFQIDHIIPISKGGLTTPDNLQLLTIEENLGNAAFWNTRGIMAYEQQKYERAFKCFDRALIIDKKYIPSWNNKGLALFKHGKYIEAINCCEEALKLDPGNNSILQNKNNATEALSNVNKNEPLAGNSNIKLPPDISDSKELIKYLTNTVNSIYKCDAVNNIIIGKRGDRYYNWVVKLKRNNDPELMKPHLEELFNYIQIVDAKTHRYVPESIIFTSPRKQDLIACYQVKPDFWINKGDTLFNMEKYEDAIFYYEKALSITQKNSNIWNSKGLALYELERYQSAIECYNKALSISPNDCDILLNKGLALNEQGKYFEAIKCYDIALQIAPGDIDIWKNKAKALDNLGKHDEAKECYAKVAEMMKQ